MARIAAAASAARQHAPLFMKIFLKLCQGGCLADLRRWQALSRCLQQRAFLWALPSPYHRRLTGQASRLNVHTRYLHNTILDYVERLTALFDPSLDMAMLTCSGSEANELALRMVRHMTGHQGLSSLTAPSRQ